jgi:integral membrane protein (TIGR01906 family)
VTRTGTSHRHVSERRHPAGRDVRLIGRVLVGLGLAILVLGLSVAVLVQPWFTGLVSARTSRFAEAGLTSEKGLEVAQGVREFVSGTGTDVDSDLPRTVDGRAAFGPDERAHLEDVAELITNARILTGLVGGALTIWLLVEVIRRRTLDIARGLRMGAYMSVGFTAVALIAGGTSFDWLFTTFHSLFFEAGSWTFPSDSLLIQLFPEAFWVVAAAAWAALVLIGAAALWLAALWLERSEKEGPSADSAR